VTPRPRRAVPYFILWLIGLPLVVLAVIYLVVRP
jgi:hypothetical protein